MIVLVAVAAYAACSVPTRASLEYVVFAPAERQLPALFPLHEWMDKTYGHAFSHAGRVSTYEDYFVCALATSQGWANMHKVPNTWLGYSTSTR